MGALSGDHLAASSQRSPSLSGTAWLPDGDLQLVQWLDYGRRLGQLGRGVAWWIGDWLRYGNARYGEKYSRAARATGYDAQSLMNMAYVASRFSPARRRELLSWSHHAEVAALAPEEQERWLDLAEAERLSVHSLRLEVRAARRSQVERHTNGHVRAAEPRSVVCPNCRHVLDVP